MKIISLLIVLVIAISSTKAYSNSSTEFLMDDISESLYWVYDKCEPLASEEVSHVLPYIKKILILKRMIEHEKINDIIYPGYLEMDKDGVGESKAKDNEMDYYLLFGFYSDILNGSDFDETKERYLKYYNMSEITENSGSIKKIENITKSEFIGKEIEIKKAQWNFCYTIADAAYSDYQYVINDDNVLALQIDILHDIKESIK